ncbi:MAG: MFS transporter [Thermoleophilia bacterium]
MTTTAADRRAGRARWVALVGATASQVGLSFLEQGVPSLVPAFKKDFGLSTAVAGLFGTSINLGRAIAGTAAIGPVNRFSERRTMLVSSTIAGVLALAAAASPAAPAVLVLLMLSGVAQTVAVLAGINAVVVWFREGNLGIAMGIRQTAVPIGGVLAAASLPFMAIHVGWRPALVLAGGLTILTAVVGALVYRDYAGAGATPAAQTRLRDALPAISRDRDIRRAIFVAVALAAGQYVVLAYVQLFLHEDLGVGLGWAAVVLTIVEALGIVGRLCWGVVSDVVFGGSRKEVLAIICGVASAAAAGMALLGRGTALWAGVPLAAVLGVTTVGAPGMFLSQISDLAPARYGAATMGMAITFIQGSTVVVPPLFGVLVDLTGSYRPSWLVLAGLLAAAVPVALSVRQRPAPRHRSTDDGGGSP